MSDAVIVSRHDWVHGLVACPNCGLPLDMARDHGEFLWDDGELRVSGVTGTHARCGAPFEFQFERRMRERNDRGLTPDGR
ncbi:MAG TPA: hypothetical protein DCK98_10005 [Chloroflexi bacterium]|nr:hypothetical protein [Chloroflexota bacterium]HAL26348.1 hypothetical protein [Chloroflexota bacterium]